ncbi:MAG: hypothetical protein E6J45_07095 [Chloroflexi bacterium]|nr:MAG: hypothetical protein E6J45_07095 [Chloroflexota bacterium]
MLQTTFANGKLWGALDTALTIDSVNQAAVEYFIVTPTTASGSVSASVTRAGYLGLSGTNVTYPAVGVTTSGRGVVAFTVVGPGNFPSAGYTSLDAKTGAGAVHIVAAGAGPADGFSGYRVFANPPNFIARPRWGDYGASAVVGDSIFIASEYISQTCTLAQYETSPFGSCGGTRSSLANWATRITQLTTK